MTYPDTERWTDPERDRGEERYNRDLLRDEADHDHDGGCTWAGCGNWAEVDDSYAKWLGRHLEPEKDETGRRSSLPPRDPEAAKAQDEVIRQLEAGQ